MAFKRARLAGLAFLSISALTLAACNVDTAQPNDSSGSETGGDNSAESFEGQELVVTAFAGAWSETFSESFVQPFEERTGATVTLVPGGAAEWLTKLRAAAGSNPPYDLMAFTPDVTAQAARADVIEELDISRINGYEYLNAVLVDHAGYDGKDYGLPLTVGSTGLAYRTDKIDNPPSNWSDIFDPEYCGHVGMPPLTFNPGIEFLAGLIQENGDSMTEQNGVDAAFEQMEAAADCVSSFPADSGSMQTALQNGDVWIAPWWDGRVFAMEQEGVPVDFVYPESGAVGALTSYYLASGSQNTDLAYEFLNELAKPENQEKFAVGTWYASSSDLNEYPEEFTDRIRFGEDVYQDFAWVDYDVATPQLNAWQDIWNNIFS